MNKQHMETFLLPADEAGIAQAVKLLQHGEVVAVPTETVYGLAANAMDDNAVAKIFTAKGRPQDNPLIAHICSMEMLPQLAENIPDSAVKLAKQFWPGPLTMVLPCTQQVADGVTAGLKTVGVRMPQHAVALSVIRQAGFPLAAPSANLSGSPSPTTAAHVMQDMYGRIPLVLDGGASTVGLESTVLSLVDEPVILRPGYITAEQIENVLGCPVTFAQALNAPLVQGQKPQSPGMKYRHYAPNAQITIVKGNLDAFIQYVSAFVEEGTWALCFEGEQGKLPLPCVSYGSYKQPETQAAALFGALRLLDAKGAKYVFARCPDETGVGIAVYNRLLRAAGFRVVET